MKKRLFIIGILLLCIITMTACQNRNEPEPVIFPGDSQGNPTPDSMTSQSLYACELLSESEWVQIFNESPLITQADNGGCLIKNQWDTRSIFIGAFQGEQANTALQWFTAQIDTGWESPETEAVIENLISESQQMSLGEFLFARIPLYEQLEFRTEKVITVGDYALWAAYHEALTGYFEIVDADRYIRIEMIGFYPADAQEYAFRIEEMLSKRVPEQFVVAFEADNQVAAAFTPTPAVSVSEPTFIDISAAPKEIFFGSLCAGEETTIRVRLLEAGVVQNVFLVYRLQDELAENQNWFTVQMDPEEDFGTWSKVISAENDFSGFQVTGEVVIEYAVAVIYGVDGVLRSPTYSDIVIRPCGN